MKKGKMTLLAVLAVALTVVALWMSNGGVAPKATTWGDVVAEAKKGGYGLISTDDLWKRYSENRDSLIMVDTRQQWEYDSGHIQGAVSFPMEPNWFARWQRKGALSRLLGPDEGSTIVFY